MEKISVIVPIYNAEKTLYRCVQSIQRQTISNLEIILVDDGSTDRSDYLCNELTKIDNRILYLKQKWGGVSKARNLALEVATGSYIMFCNSDDYVTSDWCEKLIEKIEKDNILPMGQYTRIFEDGKKQNSNDASGVYFGKDIPNIWMWSVWRCAFKRNLIEEHRIRFDESLQYGEDMLFIMQYLRYIPQSKYCVLKQKLYYYVISEGSLSQRKYIENRWKVASCYYDYCEKYSKLWTNKQLRKYSSDFLDMFLQCLNNTMMNHEISLGKRFYMNSEIMKDLRYQKVKKWADTSRFNSFYRFALKRKNYIILGLYTMLRSK